MLFKGTIHPKMGELSFTHPHIIPNLYVFFLLIIEYILKNVDEKTDFLFVHNLSSYQHF